MLKFCSFQRCSNGCCWLCCRCWLLRSQTLSKRRYSRGLQRRKLGKINVPIFSSLWSVKEAFFKSYLIWKVNPSISKLIRRKFLISAHKMWKFSQNHQIRFWIATIHRWCSQQIETKNCLRPGKWISSCQKPHGWFGLGPWVGQISWIKRWTMQNESRWMQRNGKTFARIDSNVIFLLKKYYCRKNSTTPDKT